MKKPFALIVSSIFLPCCYAQIDSARGEAEVNIFDLFPTQVTDNSEDGSASDNIQPSVLSGNRNSIYSAASFNFTIVRYKPRGYDYRLNSMNVNALPITDLENGAPFYALLTGLNTFFRNNQIVGNLQNNESSFGSLGANYNYQLSAIGSVRQTSVSLANTNRSYRNRLLFSHNSGDMPHGWHYRIGGNISYAKEGYFKGTYSQLGGYFASLEKKFGRRSALSFNLWGSISSQGRQLGAVQEIFDLLNTKNYNPSWGWQNGKKRNANLSKQHIPTALLTYNWNIDHFKNVQATVAMWQGRRSYSSLDWNAAPDPRPDYYRYLPSFYKENLPQYYEVKEAIQKNNDLLQINWQQLYDINRAPTTIDADQQHQSHYIVGNRVNAVKSISTAAVFNNQISNKLHLTLGFNFQYQKNHYYQEVEDLLGGDYWFNVNQYASRDFPYDPISIQYDADHPSKKVIYKEKYGYDYTIRQYQFSEWGQAVLVLKKWDIFYAFNLGYKQYQRIGNVRNGLFLSDSYGSSERIQNIYFQQKIGATYKLDGVNYLYAHLAYFSTPTQLNNVFVSPRTRNDIVPTRQNENARHGEIGYIRNEEKYSLKSSFYLTEFAHGMDSKNYYDDYYQAFVNLNMINVNKRHIGGELSGNYTVNNKLSINAMAAYGAYYYTNRPTGIVTSDNRAVYLTTQTLYLKNYNLGSTPQQAYVFGINYKIMSVWNMALNTNFWRDNWLSNNPMRRTTLLLEDLNPQENGSKLDKILDQQKLENGSVVNLFTNYYWRMEHRMSLSFNLGVNNLLNKVMRSGGYEQLRFDVNGYDADRFPPKYFYSMGLNYYLAVNFRF